MKLLGAILAGGQSRRFGSDKAIACLHDRPLLEHAADALQPFVEQTIVCGRNSPLYGMAAFADRPESDLGPLGGLCAALHHAAYAGFDAVISLGCDTPSIPYAALLSLSRMPGAGYLRQAPIIGCWPVALAASLDRYLRDGGDRSVRGWASAIGASPIDSDCDIPNLNSPSDLARMAASCR